MPKGIIHIGAHLAEEKPFYLSKGFKNTIWIEANPSLFYELNSTALETEKVFSFAITDTDNKFVKLNITNNGQSSSILILDKHKEFHPDIYVSEITEVETKRMDTLIVENNLNINDYDFVNIDVQGAELLVLKGFGNLLNDVKFIYTEINTDYLYENCALVSEIDDYLNQFNFKRIETHMTDFKWGDALYIKS